MANQTLTFADATGREWNVYDYIMIAGRATRTQLGKGVGRGFAPLDGGARRSLVLPETDRTRELSVNVLRDQLARASLHYLDDPVRCAAEGRAPQRVDPGDREIAMGRGKG